jgi:hypothetical protein
MESGVPERTVESTPAALLTQALARFVATERLAQMPTDGAVRQRPAGDGLGELARPEGLEPPTL